MAEGDKQLDEFALTQLLRLNAVVSGVITGTVAGLIVFVATNFLLVKGGPIVGPHLALLGQFFVGYQVTFVGSLVGFAYAFFCGFVLAYIFARLYNWFVDLRDTRRARRKA